MVFWLITFIILLFSMSIVEPPQPKYKIHESDK